MSPGRELAEAFFGELVRPLVDQAAPDLPYAAGLLGVGSEVLGLDDAESRDHDYGCRLTILVDDEHAERLGHLHAALDQELPDHLGGFPVRYPTTRDPVARHRVVLSTVDAFARRRLGVDPSLPTGPDWLCLTGQSVLEVVAGPVFHDRTRALGPLRERLARYPLDVERYVVASGWHQIAQELPFVGRTATRGDDLGSRVITARLARRLQHLAFVRAGAWSPYPKWAGSALRRLPDGEALAADLATALDAARWQEREATLVRVADRLAGRPATVPFFDRPYRTVDPALAADLVGAIGDPDLRRLPLGVGSIEQWSDAVDLLVPERRSAAVATYAALLSGRDDGRPGGRPSHDGRLG